MVKLAEKHTVATPKAVNPIFPLGGVTGNPVLIQSRYGLRGDFEVLIPRAAGGLAQYWRDNDNPALPWHGPIIFGTDHYDAVALIVSNFGHPGNLEAIARKDDQLFFAFQEKDGQWHGPDPIAINGEQLTDAAGTPAFIQSKYGVRGNFELVTPTTSGYLTHYWRDNDKATLPWNAPSHPFGNDTVKAVSLIESNFGNPGNLEGVARVKDQLMFFWREVTSEWFGPEPIIADGHAIHGITGTPAIIQSHHGHRGNFEVVVPLIKGGLAHYWRDNDNPALPWHGPIRFGTGKIEAVSMIQSNYGSLEVVVRTEDQLAFYWRGADFLWNGPVNITLGQ